MKAKDRLLQANDAVAQDPLDLRELLHALQRVRDGDFSARLPGDWTGMGGKIADTFNEIIATNGRMAQELERVGKVLGKEGKTRPPGQLWPAHRSMGRDGERGQYAHQRPALAHQGSHTGHPGRIPG